MNYREKFERPTAYADLAAFGEDIEKDSVTADVEFFYELYRDSFQHHVVAHLLTGGEKLERTNDPASKRLFQIDKITAYFLTTVYKPSGISRTENAAQLDTLRRAVEDYQTGFFQRVTGSPISDEFERTGLPGSNRINFLVGEIGVGKSLLATKVCHDARLLPLDDRNTRLLAVYVDFESIIKQNNGEFHDIGEDFYRQLLELILTECSREAAITESIPLVIEPDLPAIQQIRSLAIRLLKLSIPIRLLLVIDNVDRYHFFYSKYIFFEQYRDLQLAKISQNVDKLLTSLSDTQKLGDCAFCVLLVCRLGMLKTLSARVDLLNNKKRLFKDY